MNYKIFIRPSGLVDALYSDVTKPVLEKLGPVHVERASEVEWDNALLAWIVDLTRSGGPVLVADPGTGAPFANRADALAAEVAWLEAHNLGKE